MSPGIRDVVVPPAVLRRLGEICGPAHVAADATTRGVYRPTAAGFFDADADEVTPGAVVAPSSAAEVTAVLTACAETETPWAVRGAGTALTAAAPHSAAAATEGGVLIVLTRMRRILAIDRTRGEVRVQPGVSARAVCEAVAPGHVFWPGRHGRPVGTVGGALATDARGPTGPVHGTVADHVLGVELALTNGGLITLRRDEPGYDLIGGLGGSAGMLGIVVSLDLRIASAPASTRTLSASFTTLAEAVAASGTVLRAGVTPTAMEVIDSIALTALARAGAAPWRDDAGAVLLLELDGAPADTLLALETTARLCAREQAQDIQIAADGIERRALWDAHATLPAVLRRVSPAVTGSQLTVGPSRLPALLERIGRLTRSHRLPVSLQVRGGDGSVRAVISHEPTASGVARARALSAAIGEAGRSLAATIDGGTIDGDASAGKFRVLRALQEAFSSDATAAPARPAPEDRPPRPSASAVPVTPVTPVTPATAAELVEVLRAAAAAGRPLRIAGAGTKGRWGTARRHDGQALLATGGLTRIGAVDPLARTVTVDAGVRLGDLQRSLAPGGLTVALDPPAADRATLGGILATGDCGPLSHRYGPAQAQVRALTAALADGTILSVGEDRHENNTTPGLHRLFCGSYGTLGVILSLTLTLTPVPERTATATAVATDPDRLVAAATALDRSALGLRALDLAWRTGRGGLLAQCAGVNAREQAGRAAAVMADAGLSDPEVSEADTALWERQRLGQRSSGRALVWVSLPAPRMGDLLTLADRADATVVGRAARGIAYLELDPARLPVLAAGWPAGAVAELRDRPAGVSLGGPDELWRGTSAAALRLMRALKARLDPDGICNPGLFVGGI